MDHLEKDVVCLEHSQYTRAIPQMNINDPSLTALYVISLLNSRLL